MDPIILSYPSRSLSDDLAVAEDPGIGYQKDMSRSVPYDEAYFDKYVNYEGSDIAKAINDNRRKMADASRGILDMGVGSGEFMRACGKKCRGYDINPKAVKYLGELGCFLDPYTQDIPPDIDTVTLWDTLEHMRRPSDLLLKLRPGMLVLLSLPIFSDLSEVSRSKHYRPDEHYYYYTENGLVRFFGDMGYRLLAVNDGEIRAGRESILSFSFIRERPVTLESFLARHVK